MVDVFVTLVICPCALTVNTGITEAEPYVPAVTAVLLIAIVTGLLPLKLVPDKPVPIVNVFGVLAVTVPLEPKAIAVPLIVTELFAKLLFWIAVLIALYGILIVALAAAVS